MTVDATPFWVEWFKAFILTQCGDCGPRIESSKLDFFIYEQTLTYIACVCIFIKTSTLIGAIGVKLELMTDRQTDRTTNQPTDGHEESQGNLTSNKTI